MQGVYRALELIGWLVVVPLSLASLATSIVQAVGTQWGLLRHYWVVIKLLIGLFATIVLLLHMQPTATSPRGSPGSWSGAAVAAPRR
jgi:hypothetical protein